MSTLPAEASLQPARQAEVRRQLQAELARLEHRIAGEILPFWSTQGFDFGRDLFRERLSFHARPDEDAPTRAMVQARQIYVYSHAALSGLLPGGAELVGRAFDSLLRCFCEDGDARSGFAFSIRQDGTVASPVRDSYTHAFILFALAWAYRLTSDARVRLAVERTLEFVDRRLIDPLHSGLLDRHPRPAALKSQNPQMHFLEACLALHEAFPEDAHLGRAKAIVELFDRRLFREDAAVLREHFAVDWSAHSDEALGGYFEPGHHFEWTWLLQRYEASTGAAVAQTGARLWHAALASGVSPEGLVYNEVGADLRPKRTGHRLWPHAEGAKAAAARFSLGDLGAGGVGATMLKALNEVFLGRPFAGGWVDRVGPDREALVAFVPASSLYHLYGAWVEAERGFAAPKPPPDPVGSA